MPIKTVKKLIYMPDVCLLSDDGIYLNVDNLT